MSPTQVVLRIALIVFVVEGAVMLSFRLLGPMPSTDLVAMVDAIALTLIAAPLTALFVVRPYSRARDAAERKLAQASRQNSLLLSSTHDGVFGVDREGRTTFINPSAARMVGWEPDELIGLPQHEILHNRRPDGSHYPVTQCPVCASYRRGEMRQVDDEVFCRKDGSTFSVEYVTNPIRNEQGEVEGAVVTFRDITERRLVERDQQRHLSELERFNRLAVGRELRMIELKQEVDSLLGELGREEKYRPAAGDRDGP